MKKILAVGLLVLCFAVGCNAGNPPKQTESKATTQLKLSQIEKGYLTYNLLEGEAREKAEQYILAHEYNRAENKYYSEKQILKMYREYYIFNAEGEFLGN